ADLDGALLRQARSDDVLGQVAAEVGGRAVHLGRVLAGERPAAVRGRAAIGVDDDLAPGQAGVAVRPADLEAAGGVDVPLGLLGDQPGGEDAFHIGPDLLLDALGRRREQADTLLVLGRD